MPTSEDFIPLSGPDITDADRKAVAEVLSGNTLALGPRMVAFEEALAAYVGRAHGIAVSSGTAGLHLIIRALGIGGLDIDDIDGRDATEPPDEVITTPFSFVASANCILFQNAVPRFVDIDPETLNINPELIEAALNERTRAILPVDVFGLSADMSAIMQIARKRNLKVIEDACEALGAECAGKPAGSFGEAAVFAFYPNKQITTGEGGMIVTDDAELAQLCRSMRNQGRAPDDRWLAHERLGFNYRMDEMSAALGLSQLNRIDEIVAARAEVAGHYISELAEVPEIETLATPVGYKRSWFVFVVKVMGSNERDRCERDRVMDYMNKHGVQCRPYFTPIHLQPFYVERFGYAEGDFPVTEAVSRRTLALPFHSGMSGEEVRKVVEVLREAI